MSTTTTRKARQCWDSNQYSLLHSAISAQMNSGKSLITIVQDAMVKVIASAEHRVITATSAKQIWEKAQEAANVPVVSAPLAPILPLPTATVVQPVVVAPQPKSEVVVQMTKDDVIKFIKVLSVGTVIRII